MLAVEAVGHWLLQHRPQAGTGRNLPHNPAQQRRNRPRIRLAAGAPDQGLWLRAGGPNGAAFQQRVACRALPKAVLVAADAWPYFASLGITSSHSCGAS